MKEKSFIDKHPLSQRSELSKKLLNDFPTKIPVICEPYESNGILTKCQYLTPENIPLSKFLISIREKLKLTSDKPLFLYVNDECIDLNYNISNLYTKYKNEDNFLYIKYDFVRRDIPQSSSIFNFWAEGTKIKLNAEDKVFKVIKINWYYRREYRFLYMGDFCLYRLSLDNEDSKEYQVRNKIQYSEIEDVQIINEQLVISYKSGLTSYKDYYEDDENNIGMIKDLQTQLKNKINILKNNLIINK